MNRDFNDPSYKAWRQAVYARDRFRCQMPGCGCTTTNHLNAHHIKRWADYPDLRFEVSNGITLCHNCHSRVQDKESQFESLFMSVIASKKSGSLAGKAKRPILGDLSLSALIGLAKKARKDEPA